MRVCVWGGGGGGGSRNRRPFSSAQPNQGHVAVRKLQEANVVRCVITQNVDGLHSKVCVCVCVCVCLCVFVKI
jgi:hypothetical protein